MEDQARAQAPGGSIVADPLIVADAWLNIADLEKLTRMHRRTIYRMIAAGTFPRSFELGANTSRWRLSDYQEWSRARSCH